MYDAMYEISRRLEFASGKEQEQAARLFLNVINIPLRHLIIPMPDGKTPYLERFILDDGDQSIPKEQRSKVYLHLIYEADGDRDPHDHPFDFTSTIIWGGYDEVVYTRWCTKCDYHTKHDDMACIYCARPLSSGQEFKDSFVRGMQNKKKAHHLHRITKLHNGPVVTLVQRGPKIREWGFQTPEGWELSKDYIARKFPGAQPTEVD